ncbi:fasciclin domain-containing protein [Rhabdothermincola salaria]|uniref:fasciclin domain-containing protein n=1 Tax=Rhabdothermincola salaria TaxID=2903142 RepID=UPI001E449C28|nr:fasciclin domain-containing protein [Rhabdothermincola salaria]MCD9622942.1 fasciclin domain-containing protein [Rhabdothermincola salaria]
MKLKTPVLAAAVSLALFAGACSSDSDDDAATTTTAAESSETTMAETEEMEASETIVEIAAGNDDFSTLVAALEAADLVDTLSGDGPFTVFAPTNEAFEALPEGTVETLLEPENIEQLQAVLTYHVVAGEVMAADVEPGEVTTVEGGTFTISVEDGNVFITDAEGGQAQVVTTDIVGSNGVIHVIDAVLLPGS